MVSAYNSVTQNLRQNNHCMLTADFSYILSGKPVYGIELYISQKKVCEWHKHSHPRMHI